MSETSSTYRACIGLGTIVACIASWTTNHSIGWLIVHGFFGWLYVIYWFLTGQA